MSFERNIRGCLKQHPGPLRRGDGLVRFRQHAPSGTSSSSSFLRTSVASNVVPGAESQCDETEPASAATVIIRLKPSPRAAGSMDRRRSRAGAQCCVKLHLFPLTGVMQWYLQSLIGI